VILSLIAIAVTSSSRIVWNVEQSAAADESAGDSSPEIRSDQYERIMTRRLFSIKELSGGDDRQDIKYRLVGTANGRDGRTLAVIAEETGREHVLAPGDKLPGMGEFRQLTSEGASFVSGDGSIITLPALRREPLQTTSEGVTQDHDGHWIVKRRAIQERIQRIDRLMQECRAEPVYEGGKPSALRLVHISEQSVLTSLGLRTGDIIRSINDRRLESLDQTYMAYLDLINETSITLDLERDGKRFSFTYEIQ